MQGCRGVYQSGHNGRGGDGLHRGRGLVPVHQIGQVELAFFEGVVSRRLAVQLRL